MEIVLKHIYKIFIYIYVDEDFLLMCVKMKNMLEDELGCGIFFPEKYYVEKWGLNNAY